MGGKKFVAKKVVNPPSLAPKKIASPTKKAVVGNYTRGPHVKVTHVKKKKVKVVGSGGTTGHCTLGYKGYFER